MKKGLICFLLVALFSCESPEKSGEGDTASLTTKKTAMYDSLYSYANNLTFEFEQIPEERRAALATLADHIRNKRDSGRTAKLVFICTHNSRRSHMGQIWAAAAAKFYNIEGVETYSGGTEATAFNPRAVAAMENAGFTIDNPGGTNPRYRVHFAEGDPGIICFSKKYDDPANPNKDFAAVMTCSQADAECPFIPGASFRLSLPYNDPKEADGTPEETARYRERCRQIGREMMFAFSLL